MMRALIALSAFCLLAAPAVGQQTTQRARRAPDARLAAIQDVPGLPRVLLIGDSISIGYTLSVREKLQGEANVHRIPTNGGPTIRGLESIDSWLGDSKWDVIHFNWGLHDLRIMEDTGKQQVTLDEYKQNLEQLVERMKQTDATLIWCSTTPVPPVSTPARSEDDVLAYNAAAREIMQRHDVIISDLHGYALPRMKEIQLPDNVHFHDEGSAVLAEHVAAAIRKALKR